MFKQAPYVKIKWHWSVEKTNWNNRVCKWNRKRSPFMLAKLSVPARHPQGRAEDGLEMFKNYTRQS